MPTNATNQQMHRGKPTIERFMAKVDVVGPVPEGRPDLGPCWIWTAGKSRDGYGLFHWLGRSHNAHRVIYFLVVGEIDEGHELDHLCRNRACVNTGHLEPTTHLVNCRRGEHATKTHCKRGHKFTPQNTYVRRGHRWCRACAREEYRRRRGLQAVGE